MTTTEKKYSRHLGCLYWQPLVYSINDEQKRGKRLVMINKLFRRHGQSGDYYLQYDIIDQPEDYKYDLERRTFSVRAKLFEDYIKSKQYCLAT